LGKQAHDPNVKTKCVLKKGIKQVGKAKWQSKFNNKYCKLLMKVDARITSQDEGSCSQYYFVRHVFDNINLHRYPLSQNRVVL